MAPTNATRTRRAWPSRLLLVLALAMALGAPDDAAAAVDGAPPVVVELFTSQGCSSCPPADAILAELAERSDLVALSLHVDYWDYIGWKDPFGSPLHTTRQRNYASELGLRYVFTPQVVVDGAASVVGSDRAALEQAIAQAKSRTKPLSVIFSNEGGGRVFVSDGVAPPGGAAVWLAVYDEEHATVVKRGENAGRELRSANVVRRLERIGTWTGNSLEIPLDFAGAAARGRYACAVIVQAGEHGAVLGAAKIDLDSDEH